LQAYSEDV